jgi:hypothetical protein
MSRRVLEGTECDLGWEEIIVVGSLLSTVPVRTLYAIRPNGRGRIITQTPSLMDGFEDMEIGIRGKALINPAVEIIPPDPVPVMAKEPILTD